MRHPYSLALTALLATGWGSAMAQGEGGGPPVGWLKLSSELPWQGHWHLYTEVESRQGNDHLTAQQLGRVGLRLRLGRSFSLTTGYVLALNESRGRQSDPLPEHRLYQEVAVADASGLLRVGHRLRAEERWLRPSSEASFQFAPRLRYQLRLVAPLRHGGKLPVASCYLVAADEVFAGLGATAGRRFLEENRLSAGLGYRLSRPLSVELAYLHQAQAATLEMPPLSRNAVQLSIAYTPPVARGEMVKW
jgi:hypothetical protein